MFSERKTFLFLTADTGNGHNAAAAAVAQAVRERGHRVEIVHPIEESGRFNRWIAGTYDWALQHHAHRMDWYFAAVNHFRPDRHLVRLKTGQSWGLGLLRQFRPDLVVSFHPMLNYPFALFCGQTTPPIPTACVVTDPLPPFWEGWTCPGIDRFFVATPEAATSLCEAGISSSRISSVGLPVTAPFEDSQPMSQDWYLQNRMDPDVFTLFLNAGWLGSNDFLGLYQAVAEARLRVQIVYIHGRKQERRAFQLAANSAVPTLLMPRAQQMYPWMKAADLMVSKPGALTVFEAFATGLAVAVNALTPIMPQERGLAEAIRAKRLGFWISTPAELVRAVRRALECPAELQEICANIRSFYRPGAAQRIAHGLDEMCGAESPQSERPFSELQTCGGMPAR